MLVGIHQLLIIIRTPCLWCGLPRTRTVPPLLLLLFCWCIPTIHKRARAASAEWVGLDDSIHEIERMLWDAAIDVSQSQPLSARAAASLARLWQDDAEALCHVTAVLATLGNVSGATATCRQALRVHPYEPCVSVARMLLAATHPATCTADSPCLSLQAIFCSLHFALWRCEFDAFDVLRLRAIDAVATAVAGHTCPYSHMHSASSSVSVLLWC